MANAAVLLFGGIDTTEGIVLNAVWHLLSDPEQLRLVRADPDVFPDPGRYDIRRENAARHLAYALPYAP